MVASHGGVCRALIAHLGIEPKETASLGEIGQGCRLRVRGRGDDAATSDAATRFPKAERPDFRPAARARSASAARTRHVSRNDRGSIDLHFLLCRFLLLFLHCAPPGVAVRRSFRVGLPDRDASLTRRATTQFQKAVKRFQMAVMFCASRQFSTSSYRSERLAAGAHAPQNAKQPDFRPAAKICSKAERPDFRPAARARTRVGVSRKTASNQPGCLAQPAIVTSSQPSCSSSSSPWQPSLRFECLTSVGWGFWTSPWPVPLPCSQHGTMDFLSQGENRKKL